MADFTSACLSGHIESYADFDGQAIVSGQQGHVPFVDCQARFLALAGRLNVPVIGRGSGRGNLGSGTASLGQGLSFSVSRPFPELRLEPDSDIKWANAVRTQKSKLWEDWFQNLETGDIGLTAIPRSNNGESGRTLLLKHHVIKRILHRGLSSNTDSDTNLLAAITNEIRVLCRDGVRSSHHIVSLIAIAWDPHPTVNDRFWPCLILEGAPHGRMDVYLRSNQETNYATKLSMLLGVVSAMAWLYEFGVVHRDIKPANILVFDLPPKQWLKDCLAALDMAPVRIKLCDFGCAAILDDYQAGHEFTYRVGTPGWMAPEVSMGLPIRPNKLLAADIFSLGLVAASVFSNGKDPFPAGTSTTVEKHEDSKAELARSLHIENLLAEISLTQDYEPMIMDNIKHFLSLTVQPQPEDRAGLPALHEYLKGQLFIMAFEVLQDLLENSLAVDGSKMFQDMMENICHFPIVIDTPLYIRDPRPYLGKTLEDIPYHGFPDIVYESDFRWMYLPKRIQQEIWHDIRVRSEGIGRDAGLCSFLAASLIINDAATTPEGASFHPYLENAVRHRERLALCDAINIFTALQGWVPEDVQSKVFEYFQDVSFKAKAIAHVKCGHYKGFKVDRDMLVGWSTFVREQRSEYLEFLQSEDYCRITSTIPAIALECLRAHGGWLRVPVGSATWNCQQLTHNPFAPNQILEIYDTSFFVAEVMELGCLDEPDEEGFTLLQRAVFHGNQIIAELLLDSLGADVEAFGLTPQWTPLWLACWLGHYEMAVLLLAHGAALGCRDTLHRCGPLELLNQFQSEEQVEGIGYSALAHGVTIQDGVGGHHKSTLSFCLTLPDFSNGAAYRFLLQNGAVESSETLIHYLIRLDYETLKQPRVEEAWEYDGAKFAAVQILTRRTKAEHILCSGSRYRDELTPTLRLLTTPARTGEFSTLAAVDLDAVSAALAHTVTHHREDLLQALLSIHPYAQLDYLQKSSVNRVQRIPLICLAIDSGHPGCVRVLIEHGADVLGVIRLSGHALKGGNMIDSMAYIVPSMIPLAVKQLGSRNDVDIKAVLTRPNGLGPQNSVFKTLLQSGGWFGEFEIAEHLRVHYSLEHDDDLPDNAHCGKITLTARLLVDISTIGRLTDMLPGLRYLLNLQPRPRFSWGDERTLLHVAVRDPLNMPPEEKFTLLRLLVNTYPDETMAALLQGTVFHFAAQWANIEALEFLQDHIEISPVAQTLAEEDVAELRHYNNVYYWKDHPLTPLDASMQSVDESLLPAWDKDFLRSDRMKTMESLRQGKTWGVPWDLGRSDITEASKRPLQCYQFLRANGALHFDELEGYLIRGYIFPADVVSHDEFISLLKQVATKHSLGGYLAGGKGNARHVPPVVSQAPPLPSGENLTEVLEHVSNAFHTRQAMAEMRKSTQESLSEHRSWFRVCEIVWRHSNFYISGYILGTGFRGDDIKAELDSWVQYRLDDRIFSWLMSGEKLYGNIPRPFTKLKYSRCRHNRRDTMQPGNANVKDSVDWSRGGKVWSEEEVEKLADGVMTDVEQSLALFSSNVDITHEMEEIVPMRFGPDIGEYYSPSTSQKGKKTENANQGPEGPFLAVEIDPKLFPYFITLLAELGFEFQEDRPTPGYLSVWPHGVPFEEWPALMKELTYKSQVEVWKDSGVCGPDGPSWDLKGLPSEELPGVTKILADRGIKFNNKGGGSITIWPPVPTNDWPDFLDELRNESRRILEASSARSLDDGDLERSAGDLSREETDDLWNQVLRAMQNLGPKRPNVDHS